jgi:two-component system osmolarity sensor histidine kinase EnvZ
VGEVKVVYLELQNQDMDEAVAVAKLLSFKISKITTDADKLYNLRKSNTYLKELSAQISSALAKPVIAVYLHDKGEIIINIFHSPDAVYALKISHKKIHSPTVIIFFLWTMGAAFLLILISVVFMKNQIRAILQLADAADKLGKGQAIYKFKPSGAKEVRAAGKAFLRMKARIERQIYYRTQLLAHISHDLRTPLTRVRLSTEFIDNKEVASDLNNEIKLMENIIDEYLNFAKEEGNERLEKFDLVSEIAGLVKAYNNDKITFATKVVTCMAKLKPHAFKRAVNNLIDNALNFCKNQVRLEFVVKDEDWYLYIDDDGKGIPKSYYKKVFKPFYKLDKSSKGFGLGLAAVKSIIYGQGGKIKLAKSELGGLRVIVKVPL